MIYESRCVTFATSNVVTLSGEQLSELVIATTHVLDLAQDGGPRCLTLFVKDFILVIEVCKCDKFGSYSGTCHAETGQCTCRPGVEGNRCNACKLGFWNFQALIDGKKAGCTGSTFSSLLVRAKVG